MTIQTSVVIWTLICFVLLMLILNFLLFKPVLDVMDKRRRRVEQAAMKKAEEQRIAEEAAEKRAAVEAKRVEEEKKRLRDEADLIYENSKHAVEKAKNERLREVELFRENTEAEYESFLHICESKKEELAKVFAENMISG